MHKSWGNAIEFDEAAERMGVDVMRWMFAKARPEDNILFGWHAADEARRELLVLWNVYAFFVTYARLAGWTPDAGIDEAIAAAGERGPRSTAGSCRARPGSPPTSGARLADFDALGATRALSAFIDDLSTWYLRRSRDRMRARRRPGRPRGGVRDAPRGARQPQPDARADPAVPGRDAVPEPRRARSSPSLPDSVHLTRWPAAEMAALRDEPLERSMARRPRRGRPGPHAARPGRAPDAPAARARVARPARTAASPLDDELLELLARRAQRQGGRASSATTPRSSSGASSRCCRRSASGSGRRSRP